MSEERERDSKKLGAHQLCLTSDSTLNNHGSQNMSICGTQATLFHPRKIEDSVD
jgi:hypothetical protein